MEKPEAMVHSNLSDETINCPSNGNAFSTRTQIYGGGVAKGRHSVQGLIKPYDL